MHLETHGAEDTRRLAARIAARLTPGTVLALHGDLGAGKTCFVQGLAAALGVTRPVNSPTYTLAAEYRGRLPLYHLDLYRIHSPAEVESLGIDDYLFGDGVAAIEWAERIAPLLPETTLHLRFAPGAGPDDRTIALEPDDAARRLLEDPA
jgi:tRNA threonylcarbamoyladenosine biosynthesis protein TsaE